MNQPKVELVAAGTEAPSAMLVKKAIKEATCTDERGRVILLRKPPVLAQFHLVEALGDAASNPAYMRMAFPLLFVAKVNEIDIYTPNSKKEFEALVQLLDEDGIEAVMVSVEKHFGKADPEADKAAIKK